jgi:hypothetical protein
MDELEKKELRTNLRLNWLASLAALADIEVQQRWLNKNITNPEWSYVEFMASYFDDIVLLYGGYEKMIHDGFLSQEEYNCVKEFHNALDDYTEPNGQYDHEAILKDPTWQEIVTLGKQSNARLATLLVDPSEKNALAVRALTEKDYTWPN